MLTYRGRRYCQDVVIRTPIRFLFRYSTQTIADMKYVAFFLTALFVLTTDRASGQAIAPDVHADFSSFLDTLADEGRLSGIVMLASRHDRLFDHISGLADRSRGEQITLDTRFNVASIGKSFTAVAIAQLAEQKLLDYRDSIADHISDYPNPDVADRVTIHHLLTHTSGLGNYPFTHEQTSVSGMIDLFASDGLRFEPGADMGYSNAGFVILGRIVEVISGQNYFDYIQKNVFESAEMSRSGFFRTDEEVDGRAIGYTRMNESGERTLEQPVPNNDRIELMGSPAGGAYSTARDLIAFGRALMNNELVGPEHMEIITTGKVEMGRGMTYAYGFGDHRRGSLRSIGHNGGAPGIGCDFRIYPEKGLISVILTNIDPDVVMQISRQAGDVIRSVE